jgi:hypothetical protein
MARATTSLAVIGLAATLGLGSLGFGSAARAQSYSNIGQFAPFPSADRGRNVSVTQRDRPEYAAPGLRAGAFLLFPTVNLAAGSVSNVLATKSNKQGSAFFDFAPSLALRSDWSRNSVAVNASLLDRRYSEVSSQNYTDWQVNTSGKLQVVGDSYLAAGAEAKRDHITPDQISYPTNAREPVPTTTTDVFARGVYQNARVRLLTNILAARVNFTDVDSTLGGRIDQDVRDFDNYAFTGRGDYGISPAMALFAEVKHSIYKYDTRSLNGLTRDSTQTEALVGASFDLTSLMRGEVGVGYLRRSYDDPAFSNISGFAVRGEVEYFPTQLTTVTFTARRSVEDSILANTGGFLSTYGAVRVDHELLRNLLLRAQFGYENDSFRGADRKDKVKDFSLGASYLMNRYIALSAAYTRRERDSSGASQGPSFAMDKFALTLTLQH